MSTTTTTFPDRSSGANSASYGRATNSELIETVSFAHNSQPVMTPTKTWINCTGWSPPSLYNFCTNEPHNYIDLLGLAPFKVVAMYSPESNYPTRADIDEMKIRQYDAATIAEAEEDFRRGLEAERLCKMVREAFAGVELGEGLGLREARSMDADAGPIERTSYRRMDEKKNWQSISSKDLRRFDALLFLDARGSLFHLPAYIICDLTRQCGGLVVSKLIKLTDYQKDNFSILTPQQREAVRKYLLFKLDDPSEMHFRQEIERALADYWHN